MFGHLLWVQRFYIGLIKRSQTVIAAIITKNEFQNIDRYRILK